jgi:hypothetical protein
MSAAPQAALRRRISILASRQQHPPRYIPERAGRIQTIRIAGSRTAENGNTFAIQQRLIFGAINFRYLLDTLERRAQNGWRALSFIF